MGDWKSVFHLGKKEVVGTLGIGAGVPFFADVAPHLGQNPFRPPRVYLYFMPEA